MTQRADLVIGDKIAYVAFDGARRRVVVPFALGSG
jgi:hypothetical protein